MNVFHTLSGRALLTMLLVLFWPPRVSYAAPAHQARPPVRIEIVELDYDPDDNLYRVNLSMSGNNQAQAVIVSVDAANGTRAMEPVHIENPTPTLRAEFSAAGFVAEAEYLLKIRAVDFQGNLIERSGEGYTGNDERGVLVSSSFTHSPPTDSFAFTIQTVDPLYDTNRLVMVLEVAEPGRVMSYHGYIETKGGNRVADIEPGLFSGLRIEIDLPAAMREVSADGQSQAYQVHLTLTTREEQQFIATKEFETIPPAAPGMMEELAASFNSNPLFLFAMLFVISIVVVYFVRRNRAPTPGLTFHRPPVDNTAEFVVHQSVAQPAPTRRVRVRIRILESPRVQSNTEKIIQSFPYTLGRQDFPGDSQLSRSHAELSVRSGQFYITDKASRNGTTVRDVQLAANQTMPLEGVTVVRLGFNTLIEIVPEG